MHLPCQNLPALLRIQSVVLFQMLDLSWPRLYPCEFEHCSKMIITLDKFFIAIICTIIIYNIIKKEACTIISRKNAVSGEIRDYLEINFRN
jgi:hypothetical protein